MKPDRIAILGAGSWGTALAILWAKEGTPVLLWGRSESHVARLDQSRENSDYLPGAKFPPSLFVTSSLEECASASLLVFVVPSVALRDIAGRIRQHSPNEQSIMLSCTKGIEHGSGLRMTEILREQFPGHGIAVLSGPNLAHEVSSELPTATVLGCNDQAKATALQARLGTPRFRVYTSPEVAGIELGGALKNIFAIAAGVADGLGLGDNAKAALVTRALAELVRLGIAMGGNTHTFYGLSGAGDLIVTCYSERSRNHTVGKRLGRGESIEQITASMKMVAEGIPTTRERLRMRAPIEHRDADHRSGVRDGL